MSHIEETTPLLNKVHIKNDLQSMESGSMEECHGHEAHDCETQSIELALAVEADHDHMVCEREDAVLADNSRSLQTTPVKMQNGAHSRRKSSRGSRNAQKLMSFQDSSVVCTDNQHEDKQNAA